MNNIADFVWQQLQDEITRVSTRVTDLERLTQRAETVGGFASFAYADRPLSATGGMQPNNSPLPSNNVYVDMGFCYNARKSGEGVGAGTGVPCFYDPVVNDWRRFEDNAIIAS